MRPSRYDGRPGGGRFGGRRGAVQRFWSGVYRLAGRPLLFLAVVLGAWIALVCAIVLFAPPAAGQPQAASPCPADVNRDGRVDATDLALVQGSWGPCGVQPPEPSEPGPRGLGVTTTGVASYLRDSRPFADRVLHAEVFAAGIARTPEGWPVPTGAQVAYLLTDSGGAPVPAGSYVVRWRGRGDVRASDRGRAGPQPAGVPLDSGEILTIGAGLLPGEAHTTGVQLELRASDPADPVRDVSLTPLGAERFAADPAYAAALRGRIAVLRPLGWLWLAAEADRPWRRLTAADVPEVGRRATMNGDADPGLGATLADDCGADLWLCVIDGAEESYYRAVARRWAAHAPPGRRLVVEYSNETWNAVFLQFHRINRRGLDAGLGGARRQYAREALQAYRWMRAELATLGRADDFRGVLGAQLADESVAEAVLAEAALAPDFHELVHAVAPAWYWYPSLTTGAPSVRQFADDCAREVRTTLAARLARHRALADRHHLELWTYEGGPHHPGGVDARWMAAWRAYTASEEVGGTYRLALEAARAAGVRLIVHMGLVADPASAEWFLAPTFGTVPTAPRGRAFFAPAAP